MVASPKALKLFRYVEKNIKIITELYSLVITDIPIFGYRKINVLHLDLLFIYIFNLMITFQIISIFKTFVELVHDREF